MRKNNSMEFILEKICSIESLVIQNKKMLDENLNINKKHELILSHGIVGYKEKFFGNENQREISEKEKLYAQIRQDKSLRHPHKKILEFLIEQYDYEKGVFREVNFSKIVKECKVGKNAAKGYLEFLVERGYINYRTDGYRKFYMIFT